MDEGKVRVGRNITALSVSFDSKVFSLGAVKKAAYRYLHAFATDISIVDGQMTCVLTFSSPTTEEEGVRLVNELKKEVLDQDLRERLQSETEAVRNVILAHAFSKTGLISDEPISGN